MSKENHNFTAKKITAKSHSKTAYFTTAGTKFGLSLATFALGAFLVMNIAGVGASTNPPSGNIDATFDNVNVNGELNAGKIGAATISGHQGVFKGVSGTNRQPLHLPFGVKNTDGSFLIDDDLTVSQAATVGGIFRAQGGMEVSGGDMLVTENLRVQGSIQTPSTEPMVINDNLKIEGLTHMTGRLLVNDSISVDGGMRVHGNMVVDGNLGRYFKNTNLTKYNDNPYTTIGLRQEVTATCPTGTQLIGCSGFLWEPSTLKNIEYIGAESNLAADLHTCRSYARRVRSSHANFSHYAEAICYDASSL